MIAFFGLRFCGSSLAGQAVRTTPSNKLVLLFNDEAGGYYPNNEFTVRYKHNGNDPTPVDCAYYWGVWGTCSATCGGGIRTRSPVIVTQPQNGGQVLCAGHTCYSSTILVVFP